MKKLISIRLPETLITRLDKVATTSQALSDRYGTATRTDAVVEALLIGVKLLEGDELKKRPHGEGREIDQ